MPALWSLARSAAALAAALAITVCSAAPAAATVVEPEEPAGSERAVATVRPALVRVTATFAGRVHNREGGYANNGQPYAFVFTCTGFGVHPDGYIATVGYCIDANDPSVRELFIQSAAEEAVASSPDIPLGQMIEFGRSAWDIEGTTPGTPIASQIRVTGIAGAPPDGMFARVVDNRPIGQGDVGLLKVDTTNLPTLELATGTALAVGMPLFAAGYPEGVGERIGPGATPSIEKAVVDQAATDGGRPVYRTDNAMEVGMGGGPAFDESGRVLGINSVRMSADQQLFNLVVPISGFTDLLGRNGVRAELGPRDLRYREALDAYHGGEYTDVIEAIDRLQQEGPTHPRVAQLRSDAQTSRELHGDASENRLTQLLVWGSVAAGAILIVAVGALLVARRRRRKLVPIGAPPPFPGPQPGPPWQGGPFPPPAWQPGSPNQQYGPAMYPRPAAPRPPTAAPGRPGPAPQARGHFDGPTRQIRIRRPVPPGSENATTTIAAPSPPGAGGVTPGDRPDTDQAEATAPPAGPDHSDHAASAGAAGAQEPPPSTPADDRTDA
jgi:serine protease Do